MANIVFKNGQYVKLPRQKRGTVSNFYGTLRGKVIKTSAQFGVFVQLDKNNQICDMFQFDRSLPKEERIGERVRGSIFDKYHGRPLYSNWKDLVSDLTGRKNNED